MIRTDRHGNGARFRACNLTILVFGAALAGCGSSGGAISIPDDRGEAGVDEGLTRSERLVEARAPSRDTNERPPVLLNGVPIGWTELTPMLAEAGGAQVIQEAALDRLLSEALAREGMAITESDIRRERDLLAELVETRGPSSRVLGDLRRVRGLGEERFRRTLARNAALRTLVAPGIEITEEDLRVAHAVDHGPKVRIRLIVAPTESSARSARAAVGGGPDRRARFTEQATLVSTDVSARAGGLVEPFSLDDPSYPVGLRAVLRGLQPGDLTPVVALDRGGFAIALVEGIIPGDGRSLGSVRGELERQVRLREERLAMDRLARSLLSDATITVFDPHLMWSWRGRETVGER